MCFDRCRSTAREIFFLGKISCISLCRSNCIIHDFLGVLSVVARRAVSEDSPDCDDRS